ncbi:MAG: hypothetical protein ACOX1O_07495 [Eggerthellaceae bacterium]|jgi:hypothetical protein
MADKQTGNTSKHAKGRAAAASPVRYLDPGSLTRPIDMPRSQQAIMYVFVAVAALIGILMFTNITGAQDADSSQASEEIQQIISETGTLNLPVLADYTINNADGIKSRLDDAGVKYYDNSKNSDDELDLISVPDGMKAADIKAIISEGIDSVDATTAARYLCGSWRLTGNFDNGIDLRIRYCDMNVTTADTALTDAASSQGYKAKKKKRTTDSAGNTSISGTTTFEGSTYQWTISACDLSNVYRVDGLPESAQYVGIHLTE